LIHNIDRDNDFAINYEEFLNSIISRSNDDFRKVVWEKQNDKEDGPSSSVEMALADLFAKELKLVGDLGEIAELLLNQKDFTTYEAFLSIDFENNKYIDEKSLEAFMGKHGYSLTEQDILGIIYRLDSDMDKRVSYDEFQQIFFPMKTYGNSSNYSRDYGNVTNINDHDSLKYSQSNLYQSRQGDGYKSTFKVHNVNNSQGFTSTKFQKSPIYKTSGDNFYSTNSSIGRNDMSPLKKTEEVLNKSYSAKDDHDQSRSNYRYSPRGRTSPYKQQYSPRENNYSSLNRSSRWSPPKDDTVYRSRFSPSPRNLGSSYQPTRLSPTVYSRARLCSYTSPIRNANYDVIYNSSGRVRNLSPSSYRPYVSPRREITFRSSSPKRDVYNSDSNIRLLARYFHDILTLDVATETYREALSIKSDVNLRDLFNFFDLTGRNSISLVDFREVLKELDVYSSLDEAKLLFKRYDKDMDGRIE
jgi:Ca2+-binding EF-hand superfamily protein